MFKSMFEEFKNFAMKGNVVDLAVGVVIGAAFGRIVDSIVGDVFMPIIGAIVGGLDFSNYYIPLSSAVKTGMSYADAKKAGAVLGYGQFLTIATLERVNVALHLQAGLGGRCQELGARLGVAVGKALGHAAHAASPLSQASVSCTQ